LSYSSLWPMELISLTITLSNNPNPKKISRNKMLLMISRLRKINLDKLPRKFQEIMLSQL